MIERAILPELRRCATEYPVLTITGPRQSGKTTLARATFPDLKYVNFERPDTRSLFNEDPAGFLAAHAEGAIFDEIQHTPEICSWLQPMVDQDLRPGRFVLTGSQNFGLTNQVTQSLAGRTAILELHPFSVAEMKQGDFLNDDLDMALWSGAYPPVHDHSLRPSRWYSDYVATYLERDLRQLTAIHDLAVFQRFLKLAASNVGQQINASRMGGDVGVDQKTIERWLSLLEVSYLAIRLQPFRTNIRKRLVKAPKLYFLDTGLVCHLLGIQSRQQLTTHPLRGAVFENWVAAELMKQGANQGTRPALHFWRTYDGQEVDFLRLRGDDMDLIECKSGQTVHPRFLGPLNRVADLFPDIRVRRQLIYGGDEALDLREVQIRSWRDVG